MMNVNSLRARLGVGNEDFLYKPAVAFIDLLKERKIEETHLITAGGQIWMNAGHDLAETLRLFFSRCNRINHNMRIKILFNWNHLVVNVQ